MGALSAEYRPELKGTDSGTTPGFEVHTAAPGLGASSALQVHPDAHAHADAHADAPARADADADAAIAPCRQVLLGSFLVPLLLGWFGQADAT